MLEVESGEAPQKVYFLKPRSYSLGRGRQSDLPLNEPSISKSHARIVYENGAFLVEDQGSRHGVYVNDVRVEGRTALPPGAHLQLGNLTLKFSRIGTEAATGPVALPWLEQQHLLLSLVQTINSSLVLSQVQDRVLDAVMRITRAERAFLLLPDAGSGAPGPESVAGLRVRVARSRDGPLPASEVRGISRSVVRKALQTGRTVATGNAAADPSLSSSESVILMDMRTIVCIPLPSPREGEAKGGALGAIYVDNQETSAPFSAESLNTAEALARHAALAIENARLFEREERTIEELRQAQSQLLQSAKLATIGRMAAGIVHELNTPLTYIMGNVELLQLQALSEAQKEMVGSIAKGAERLKSLAQSLLTFSRPSQEDPVALDPNDLIERSLELCHYQILKSGVALMKDLSPGLPAVRGFSHQLEMALINLVVNAVQAMERGGALKVSSRLSGDEVEIAVSDSGPGIPEEIQPSIFEPFFTTKRDGQGTGLGLSTVLMVVERHRGKVDFSSDAQAGTTFRITLPAQTLPPRIA